MKYIQKFSIILLLIIAMATPSLLATGNKETTAKASSQTSENLIEFQTISADEAKEAFDTQDDIIIVDVRTEGEYNGGHVKNSINIPLNTIESAIKEQFPEKDTKLYLYCRSGNRSSQAAKLLVKQGYTNVYDFGGINRWPFEIVK